MLYGKGYSTTDTMSFNVRVKHKCNVLDLLDDVPDVWVGEGQRVGLDRRLQVARAPMRTISYF